MKVLMPFWIGGEPDKLVLGSIAIQSIPCDLTILCSKKDDKNRAGETHNRNLIFNMMCGLQKDDFVVMQESDCLHLYNYNIHDMLNYMIFHEECGAVALRHKGIMKHESHVELACMMVRCEVAPLVKLTQHPHCLCVQVRQQIMFDGWNVCYLDEKERIRMEPRV